MCVKITKMSWKQQLIYENNIAELLKSAPVLIKHFSQPSWWWKNFLFGPTGSIDRGTNGMGHQRGTFSYYGSKSTALTCVMIRDKMQIETRLFSNMHCSAPFDWSNTNLHPYTLNRHLQRVRWKQKLNAHWTQVRKTVLVTTKPVGNFWWNKAAF